MEKERFIRNCPSCRKKIEYTNKKNRNQAERKKQNCGSCSQKEVSKRPEIILEYKRKREEYKIKYLGEGNPFYGKKHSQETRKKISDSQKKLDKKNNPIYQCKEFKEKVRRPGKLNGMYGRSFYDVWVEKYGKNEADRKMDIHRKGMSIRASGKNNSMYGKPSPKGSGNGWSGWYKKWYFRSLKELSYMINVIEKKGHKWESAENKKFYIKYINYDGDERTYRPDFLLNDKILIEVKPKELMETPSNIRKKEAAIEFCKKNNLEYRMVDIKILDTDKIIELFLSGKIKFIKKYEDRINEIINKKRRRLLHEN